MKLSPYTRPPPAPRPSRRAQPAQPAPVSAVGAVPVLLASTEYAPTTPAAVPVSVSIAPGTPATPGATRKDDVQNQRGGSGHRHRHQQLQDDNEDDVEDEDDDEEEDADDRQRPGPGAGEIGMKGPDRPDRPGRTGPRSDQNEVGQQEFARRQRQRLEQYLSRLPVSEQKGGPPGIPASTHGAVLSVSGMSGVSAIPGAMTGSLPALPSTTFPSGWTLFASGVGQHVLRKEYHLQTFTDAGERWGASSMLYHVDHPLELQQDPPDWHNPIVASALSYVTLSLDVFSFPYETGSEVNTSPSGPSGSTSAFGESVSSGAKTMGRTGEGQVEPRGPAHRHFVIQCAPRPRSSNGGIGLGGYDCRITSMSAALPGLPEILLEAHAYSDPNGVAGAMGGATTTRGQRPTARTGNKFILDLQHDKPDQFVFLHLVVGHRFPDLFPASLSSGTAPGLGAAGARHMAQLFSEPAEGVVSTERDQRGMRPEVPHYWFADAKVTWLHL